MGPATDSERTGSEEHITRSEFESRIAKLVSKHKADYAWLGGGLTFDGQELDDIFRRLKVIEEKLGITPPPATRRPVV